jgi:hypothetical protein
MGACGRRRLLGGLALLLQVGRGRRRWARCRRQLMAACRRRRLRLALLLQVLRCRRRRCARRSRRPWRRRLRRCRRGSRWLRMGRRCCGRRRDMHRGRRGWRRRWRGSRRRRRGGWCGMRRRGRGRRRRGGPGRRRRRGGGRRGMRRRCCRGRRRVRRWRSLRRRLGFSVGTKFLLRLCHNQRCGLRVRWRRHELHCRESGRGKQHKTKFYHDGLGSRKIFDNSLAINK